MKTRTMPATAGRTCRKPGPGARAATDCALLFLAGTLSGCVLTSDTVPAETYKLHHAQPVHAQAHAAQNAAAGQSAAQAQKLPFVLVVSRPRASATLDTDRIATVPGGSRFDYYAGVRWSETAPQMLQHALVDSLTADDRFEAVVAAPARVPAEMMLDLELRRFESVVTGSGSAPVVHVQMQANLVDSRQSVRVASFVSEASARATGNRLSAVIAAFEAASASVIEDIVQRVRTASASVTVPIVTTPASR